LGTLDDDPGVKPKFHMFVGSKAPIATEALMRIVATV
jgi:hypothetical protein